MSAVRTYRRKVMARRASRTEALAIATELAAGNPAGEYAIEYTPVCNQREQWRVVKLDTVPEGTPDVHPHCEMIRKQQRGEIYERWEWA